MDISLLARGGVAVQLDRPRVLFFDKTATFALVQKYGRGFLGKLYSVRTVTPATEDTPARFEFELVDGDVLVDYLHKGLAADARANGETLTLQQVESFITPTTVTELFDYTIAALGRSMLTPAMPGKADAATASPAPAATAKRAKASTTRTRSASRPASSTKRRSASGRKR